MNSKRNMITGRQILLNRVDMCGSIQQYSQDAVDGQAKQQEVSFPLPQATDAETEAATDAVNNNSSRSVSFTNIEVREYFYCLGE